MEIKWSKNALSTLDLSLNNFHADIFHVIDLPLWPKRQGFRKLSRNLSMTVTARGYFYSKHNQKCMQKSFNAWVWWFWIKITRALLMSAHFQAILQYCTLEWLDDSFREEMSLSIFFLLVALYTFCSVNPFCTGKECKQIGSRTATQLFSPRFNLIVTQSLVS